MRLAGGGGGAGASEESRAAGAGGGAEEERGGSCPPRGLSAAEEQTGDQDAPLQSGQPVHEVVPVCVLFFRIQLVILRSIFQCVLSDKDNTCYSI